MRIVNRGFTVFTARFTGLCAAFVCAAASAVTLSDLGLSQERVRQIDNQLYTPGASPGIAFGSPIAFGFGYTEFFAGIGGQTMPSGSPDDYDGSASLGLGIGDPTKWVALEVSTTIISLRDSFAEDGNFNVKLHHALPFRMAVAIGVENTGRWGAALPTDPSSYVVVTKAFDVAPATSSLPITLSLNAGMGDGRFAKPGDSGAAPFGSAALTLFRRVSFITDWTGRDFNAAVSMVPLRHLPIVITLGVINLAERYSATTEFAGGIGYTYRF